MTSAIIIKERPIQTKAYNDITKTLQTRDECLVKMFCGTGKSHIIKRLILERKHPLSVVVFPSLALIRQFTKDYLAGNVRNNCLLNVSSEELTDITSTTDPPRIHRFLNNPTCKKHPKIICVTYQSLDVLISCVSDTKIGIVCFDEAHRTTSPESVKLVYSGEEVRAKYEKRVFFTATPVNAYGITMFDRERNEIGTYGDCGPLVCEYTYLQGLRDSILSLFELRVDLYTQDTLGNMYESIARAILTTGNTRVLTFHADAAEDSKSETSVLRFVDKVRFVEAFRSVCAKEFPDKVGLFPDERITFRAITAATKDKDSILGAFDTCCDTDIYIVSSCRTIGEGVDTKKANMCVFVDPKSSPKDIIQNIGRICRKIPGVERQAATVLIPVCVGWEKYVAAGDDPEVQDKLIRDQLNDRENGDYSAIMNVCAALKQEDPELYELCLEYPRNFTESERKHALEQQGFCVLDDYDDESDDEYEPNVLYENEIDELVENGERVEIHTSNTEQPIIYRGFDEDAEDEDEDERPIQRFYEVEEENEDGEMETRYHRIVPLNDEEENDKDKNRRLDPPKTNNRPRLNIHTNDEIKLLWKMGDVVLGEQFGSGVLECQVERLDNMELWKNNHKKMRLHIDKNGKRPSNTAKHPEEKRLGQWVSTQKKNYNPSGPDVSKYIMNTNPEIWQLWTDTLADAKYSEALADPVQDWKNNHKKMRLHIDKNDKTPSQKAKDPEEKRLGQWVSNQKMNYNPSGPDVSKKIMNTNQEIWQLWTDTLADAKYSEALVLDTVQDWKNNHKKMRLHIDKNGKTPSQKAKDPEEKRLGNWVSNQKTNYNPSGPTQSKDGMKNQEIWQLWTDTLADAKYSEALADPVQVWKNNHKKIRLHIDKNGKAPSTHAKDPEEKRLGQWVSTQKNNYNPSGPTQSKDGMKNQEIWQLWTETIQKYPCLKKKGEEQEPSPPPPSQPKIKLIVKKSHLIPKSNPESLECSASDISPLSNRVITDSPYKLTGRAWATQKSTTTHEKLRSNPAEWHAYHNSRDISFQGYTDQSQIPRNRIIAHLTTKRKHKLRILDLGCGRNNIARHFTHIDKDHKFTVQGYDHVAEEGSGARVGNIADLASYEEDQSAKICVYSQSLMGSDWRDYLTEGYRILEYGGEFIISEHIKMLDDVQAELVRLGCKVESVNADDTAANTDADADTSDKIAKWFVLVARKV